MKIGITIVWGHWGNQVIGLAFRKSVYLICGFNHMNLLKSIFQYKLTLFRKIFRTVKELLGKFEMMLLLSL